MQQAVTVSAAERDRDILDLLKSGERTAAFERLVERYENKVYRLCCSMLGVDADAEDAAQESLVRVWKALGSFDGRAALSTWIYAIARNRCLSAIERRREHGSLSDAAVTLETDAQHHAAAPEVTDHLALLRELVDGLPQRYRSTLTLFYYEDRSVSEVAQMQGVPEGTVKTNLFRARALLLDQLRKLGLDESELWLESQS